MWARRLHTDRLPVIEHFLRAEIAAFGSRCRCWFRHIGGMQRRPRSQEQDGDQSHEGLSCGSVHCGTLFRIRIGNSATLGPAKVGILR